ncbi:MAG TPA: ROK family protein [Acidimicrobiales bacterium]|nr:ROK family protein [Acidimicrobiales bacterium]
MLAFDLGGTRLKAAAVDGDQPEGLVVAPSSLASVAEVGRRILDDAAACDAVALAVPGTVVGGVVQVVPGKLDGLVGVDLRAWLADAFGLPVGAVVNDAHAFGWAEAAARPGRRRVLTVTIGTGLGTALVADGEVRGLLSGQPFEARCSAAALAAETSSARAAGLDAYRADLADALAALCFAHEPEVVVLGGGPMQPGNNVEPGMRNLLNERLAPWLEVDVEAAVSGDAGGVVGVALLSR